MLKPKQVPIAACNAFSIARINGEKLDGCIAAAINAWPGMGISEKITRDKKSGEWCIPVPVLRLPVPKEREHD